MRAWWYEERGRAADVLRLGDMPAADPGPDEVRVRIHCSAVNPTDWKRRETGRELAKFDRIIPNNDGSGVIDAVGEGVDAARLGERVWLFSAQALRPFGTAAEYCTLPARQARHLPDDQSFEDGACIGVPAITAHRALFADGDVSGHVVLIAGGAGRVGRYAVQMAKHAGATVIATAGSAEKVTHVRALGADYALNYREDDIVAAVADITDGLGVHRMVDVAFGTNIAMAPQLVRDNGTITSYGSDAKPNPEVPFPALMYKNVTIRPFAIFGMPREAQDSALEYTGALMAENALSHLIDARFAFADMVAAHETIETGTLFGACVVQVDGAV